VLALLALTILKDSTPTYARKETTTIPMPAR
jgi:hypothetical protein